MNLSRNAAAILAVLIVCVANPASSRADDDATWLKTKHRAYAGFAFGDGKVRSMSYDDRVMRPGQKEPVVVSHYRRAGLVYRVDAQHVKQNETDSGGFTGNVFWYSDASGQTTRRAGNSVVPEYAENLVWTDAIATLPWHFVENVNDHGANLAVVETTLSVGMPIRLYIDAATGAYYRITIDPRGDYRDDIFIDTYGEPQTGIHIPNKYHYEGEDGAVYRDNLVVNPIISDGDLHPPAETARWTFGSLAPIPFDLTKYRIVLHAKVNGVEGRFLLDTGADSIYFTGDFARRAKIAATGHSQFYTLYGTEKTDIGKATIQLGENTLSDAVVYFGMREADKEGPDGFLGYGLFASTNLDINFDAKSLTIGDADPVLTPNAISLPASFGDGQPSIQMTLQSTRVDVTLDTGNPEGVVFPLPLLAEYGWRLASGKHGQGLLCGDLDPLTIGTFVYQSPHGCASDSNGRWVLAGLDFLRTFHSVDFDYLHGNVVFYPKPKP
jgi:hypothetical protein